MHQNTESVAVTETLAEVPEHVLRGLPEEVRLLPSAVDKTRIGVWATKPILKGKKFGPFVGDKKKRSQVRNNVYMWEVYYPNLGWMCIDATDPEKGNWLRYVNWACSGEEQNLFPLEINRAIYYKTLKPIAPGEELLVWYNGEDNPEIAAAIEEERASARSKRSSPKSRRGKKKSQENKNKGVRTQAAARKASELDSTSANMRGSAEGPKEEDERPLASAPEQPALLPEVVSQDAVPQVAIPLPACESQPGADGKQEVTDCEVNNMKEEEEEEEEELEEEEEEEELGEDGEEEADMPNESSVKEPEIRCEEKPEDLLEEPRSVPTETSEGSPGATPPPHAPRAREEANGEGLETFMFPCQHCERKFATKQGLERHMHIHISTINHAFKCKYCGKPFGTQINRRRHERRHETGLKRRPSMALQSSEDPDDGKGENVTSKDESSPPQLGQDCLILNSEKTSQEILNSSFVEENGEVKELHPCKYCKKVFGTHTNMRRHQRRVHERHLIPKGVRRKGGLLEEPQPPAEQAPPSQNVYVPSTEPEEDGDADDVYIMDISSNISENLNYYIDGKIQTNNSTSDCDVIEMESNSAHLYGIDCLLTPVTVEITQNIKSTQGSVTDDLLKESPSSTNCESKKRRTASPPVLPKIKAETDSDSTAPSCSLSLPLSISTTEVVSFHKEKGVYLSSKLKQLLQTQDKLTPPAGISTAEIPKLGPVCVSAPASMLAVTSSRFKRRTSSPPSSPQHSPALRDFGKQSDGKAAWTDTALTSKKPKLESRSDSPAWSLSGRDERETGSPPCFDEYKISKEWAASSTFSSVCNQQPLDLSSGVKQKSEGTGKTPVPWESVLDLSVHKKPCDSEGKEFKENHLAQPAAKKKKPTTCMLQKVLLNEYNGVSLPTESTPEATRSPSPCKSPDTQPDPELATDSSCSAPTAESPPEVVGPSSPPLQAASLSSGQLPPLLIPTEPSSPPPCPPVLTVATPPPPLLPTVPLPNPSCDASPQQCPSPFSNATAQSPLPILSPTVSPSPSPIPPVEPLMSAASPGPPTLSSSSSSSSSSSFSSSSCSSSSPSPPPLSAVSSVVSSGDNLEASLPAITLKQEESESEGLKRKEEAPAAGGQSAVQETFSRNFVCNVCASPFLSIKDLTKHLSVHAEEWPFKCEFCVQLFKGKTDLSEHRFLLHGVGNIFVCSVCKKEFAFLCNLQQHQRDLHPDELCTHHEFESGTLRPQNFTDPSKAHVEHMPSLPEEPAEASREEELNDSSEELYTTIKIMASGIKTKEPDVRLGLNQHYPSFKPPPFQYHHRNPMGIGVTATNFTTHNIPQTFTTAIRCTKCGKSVDNMPELHKHILACASASDKKRYTPKKNPVPLRQTVQPKNGVLVLDNSGKNAFRRMGQPKRLSFNVELSKMSPNKLKLNALKKKNQLVQKAILQKNRSAKQKADLRDTSEASSHICPYCDREFTYIGSLNKHAAFSCPKKPLSPSKRKVSHSSKKGGHTSSASSDRNSSSNPRRRTADTEIKMQSMQAPLGKTRARSTGPAQASLPSSSFRSRQNVKFAASVKSKKASSSSLRNSSPVRMAKITHVEGKKSKAVAKSHSTQLSSKASRSLHVKVQKSKAVLQSKTALASKKRTDRFIVKSRERSGGPITRSLQLAAAADLSESRREDSSARHELKDLSSDSSSTASDDSPARSVQSAAVPAPTSQLLSSLEKDEPRKSFGIKVQNLPVRSTDTSLKDGLFHEFKKFGKVTSVQIHGASEERYGLVFFRQQEDQEKALTASKGKLFFGMQIEVTAWVGPETESENEFRPLDERIDEFHPKATRTLFIGNLEKTTTYHDLRNIFQRFGEIVDIDIKKVNGVPQYAFLQYCDIASVCKAIKKMDGEYLGNNRLKLGFGKSMPTNCVWLDGLSSNVSDQYLTRHFCRYGPVVKVVFDRLKGMALVLYSEIEDAQAAVKETKGRKIGGNKIKVDFANRESQLAFYHCMEKSGQDMRDFYEMLTERREERRGSYEYSQERTYYENVRTPGTYPEDSRRDYPARGREFYSEWETYQGEYYDSRYYDEPREYREYRSDPYEQDIREYSYRQRERERERERFESDRDHERRPIERSQSPVHLRRPQSPGVSPAHSERLPSDSERRLYRRSSERSGSCSSVSPPRYDKLEKARLERYTKNEKADKERTFDPERVERERRIVRKEKGEKDKAERQKRKGKAHSPSSQPSETEQENDREQSPEKPRGSTKLSRDRADKEGPAKNRLELVPCVVLTRVKEKEGKVIEHPPPEKLKARLGRDTTKASALDQKPQAAQGEPAKSDPARGKALREKVLPSHAEVGEKEGRTKLRKHLKAEQTPELSALDLEKLEARKRRFADSGLKIEKQKPEIKKTSPETEDTRILLKKQPDTSRDGVLLREGESERKPVRKEILKRESKKTKLERLNSALSPKDCQDPAAVSAGSGSRPSSDVHAGLGELTHGSVETQETQPKKAIPSKPQPKQLQLLENQGPEKEEVRKNYCRPREEPAEHRAGQEKPHGGNAEEKLGIDIDHTQSYRKQMEQSRRKQRMEMEIAKAEKFGSPKKDVDDYERRSLVHEVGKPPQDVTDDSPPSKKRRTDHVDFDICTKRERNYRSSRQISEDSERTSCSPSVRHGSFHDDDDPRGSPRLVSVKGSPKGDEKGLPYPNAAVRDDPLKCNPYDSGKREQTADTAKIKLSVLNSEGEPSRWDPPMKQDPSRFDVSFPNSVIKRDSLRKRSVRDLEPGEVPSDSDEDAEHRSQSPRASSFYDSPRLSFLLRDRDQKLRERDERLASSLERNKFYSFALDKTITPDTKALLERAKSLSSSREENWSFLDWDSRFANFRNNKDKEKVDSAPRPIPSWYMKKKKIRTDSEGKLADKKDERREEEQERQELFASRFLHSSIFEQDSKRLQHLERKSEEPDLPPGGLYGRQASEGANSTSDSVQEPVVLFHSRFMELTRMQQKEKEKDQKPKEAEKQEEPETHPKTPEPAAETKEPEPKAPVSAGLPAVTVTVVTPEPASSAPEKAEEAAEAPSPAGEKPAEPAPVSEETKLVSEPASVPVEQPRQSDVPPGEDSRDSQDSAALAPSAPQESAATDAVPCVNAEPLTPGTTVSQVESSVDPKPSSPQPLSKLTQRSEEAEEGKVEKPDTTPSTEPDATQNAGVASEAQPPASEDVEANPPVAAKDRKTNKSKRSKTSVQAAAASVVEKPVTRKSERIDREKLKRSSSPRGEAQKLLELKMEAEKITRTASKSSGGDTEHPEPSLPLSRSRRRNVRSVYATMTDHESRSPAKEPVEQPRVTRKRLERELQEAVVPPTTPRRGRPPKTRRRAEEDGEHERKEPAETPRPAEGWRSPRSQKSAAAAGPQGKRGRNEQKVEAAAEAGAQASTREGNPKSRGEREAASEPKRDRRDPSTDKNGPDTFPVEVLERKPPEKTYKSKRGRARSTRSAMDRAAHQRSLEMAARAAGQAADKEAGPAAASPQESESPQKGSGSSPQLANNPADPDREAEEESASASTAPPEGTQLARQIELEQAVQNIAKLPEPSAAAASKGTATATAASEEPAPEHGHKPAHQASETELAAAIGSIISDASGEPENFSAPPSVPPGSQTHPREGMEPGLHEAESGILETGTATESSAPQVSALDPPEGSADTKETRGNSGDSVQEAKGSKVEVTPPRKDKGRQKTTRRRKRNANKKVVAITETRASEAEQTQSESPAAEEATAATPEAPQEEKQSEKPPSPPAECTFDPSKTPPAESLSQENSAAEKTPCKAPVLPALPPLSQPALMDDGPQARFKVHSIIESDPVTPPSDSGIPPPTIPLVTIAKLPPPVIPGGVPHQSPPPKVTEWITRQEEPRAQSTPSPALPPDTKASDMDTSSSTLRKILMDPKYVSATGVTSTSVTSAIAEPVSAPCLQEAPAPPCDPKHPPLEGVSAAAVPNADTQASEVPVAADKEKVAPVIAPKITSVISRMPVSIDLENSQKITLAKPAPQTLTGLVSALTGLVNVSLVPVNALKGPVKGSVATLKGLVSTPAGPVNLLKGPVNVLTGPVNVLTTPVSATVGTVNAAPGPVTAACGVTATTGTAAVTGAVTAPAAKGKQRASSNENSRFHPGSMSVIDDRPADTGSGAGLRVNTSEGVVLLSYSGQKTEGPQRISAKISQIPPASAMDIEFQQSVSKSQVKADSITPTQSAPKGPQTPSAFANVAAHSTLVLTAQTYNASPVISSVKTDRPSLEKPEPIHLSVSTPVTQGGTVKVLTQGINTPPVLVHNQLVLTPSIVTTNKKLADPVTLKIETKVLQPANLGPTLTPHHPPALPSKLPAEVNHVPSGPSTPADRTIAHLATPKPDTHSPRPTGPTPGLFPRPCHPSSTTSTALSTNATVMLAAGIPVPQFISSIHPEQSVIMPPHSITQTVSLGHLSQGEVRMSTPTLPSITYSIRPETLHSPRAPLQPQQIEARAPQRVGTPQPATTGVPALATQHPPEEEVHYHLPVARAAAPVQSEVLVMQSEYRLHPYTVPRDVRIMVHPHVTAVSEQPRATEGVVKVPPANKAPQQLVKEAVKTSDAKAVPAPAPVPVPVPVPTPAPPPHGEARILTVTPSSQLQGLPLTPPVVVTHGVQIVHSSGELFQEYRYGDVRTYHAPAQQLTHTQFPVASSISLASRTKTSAQVPPEGEPLQSTQSAQPAPSTQATQPIPPAPPCQPSQLSQPAQPPSGKIPQVSQEAKGTQTGGVEQTRLPAIPTNRPSEPHAQLQRAPVETAQPAHPSPVSVSMKPDLPSPLSSQAAPKQPLFVPANSGPSTPPGLALPHAEVQPAPKQESSPHGTPQRPVDMVQLLKKYPIVWQGLLALKNDTAAVQLHFVSGNNVLAHRSLPLSEGGPPLRIAQRMRLEASQLEGVARRMTVETDYCLLLALPCGRDQEDVVSQTESLKAAFITYLQAKQAAGIINVPNPGSNQPAYVLQIFPPCEFSESHLSRLAPDLLASISNISPHLMIVIASV